MTDPSDFMILLVEDDAALAEATYLMLDLQGYTVSVAANGKEALTQLTWQTPDLIITDWHMPKMSGIELCNMVRSSHEFGAIPIILVSGLLPRATCNPPYNTFIQKPFLATRLLNNVERPLLQPSTPGYPLANSDNERV